MSREEGVAHAGEEGSAEPLRERCQIGDRGRPWHPTRDDKLRSLPWLPLLAEVIQHAVWLASLRPIGDLDQLRWARRISLNNRTGSRVACIELTRLRTRHSFAARTSAAGREWPA